MKLDVLISKRFHELHEEAKHLWSPGTGDRTINFEVYNRWSTSVLSFLGSVFGEDSAHFRNFLRSYDSFKWNQHDIESVTGIFQAALRDYEAGYLFKVEGIISGEIFGDFVALAKRSLDAEQKDVAAVLACAALEDCLKKYATMKGLDVDGKNMHDIIGALKSKGLVSGAQKSLLDTMPKLRDYAMHANWAKITPADVGGLIGFVENFLLTHFD